MGAHLNPLEKETLIKRYLSNPGTNIKVFCDINHISTASFKSWMTKYHEEGIEGLISKGRGAETQQALPNGVDITKENLKRELMKLRIENERLKKNYTVETTPNGGSVFKRLRKKSTK